MMPLPEDQAALSLTPLDDRELTFWVICIPILFSFAPITFYSQNSFLHVYIHDHFDSCPTLHVRNAVLVVHFLPIF